MLSRLHAQSAKLAAALVRYNGDLTSLRNPALYALNPASDVTQFSKAKLVNFGELEDGEIPEALKYSRPCKIQALTNGLRVATEATHSPLVHVALMVQAGTRNENMSTSGIGHFLGHLKHQGTESMSGAQIVGDLADVGGSVWIEPGHDATVYHLEVLKEGLPKAFEVLERIVPGVATMGFMTMRKFQWERQTLFISRSGYTGEDGYEISVPGAMATAFARVLLADSAVLPIGLGARDSLRLEAGLCLYGHDIDEATTPVEADLVWAIGKRRKLEKGFPGDARILDEIFNGAKRVRVGLKPDGKAPAREGAEIVNAEGDVVGRVTSGGFGPSVNGPVAMGYVSPQYAKDGTALGLKVRTQVLPARVVAMPFVPKRFFKG